MKEEKVKKSQPSRCPGSSILVILVISGFMRATWARKGRREADEPIWSSLVPGPSTGSGLRVTARQGGGERSSPHLL